MKNYRIAIPSYNRPEIIKTKTLALLESYNIPFENKDLFWKTMSNMKNI